MAEATEVRTAAGAPEAAAPSPVPPSVGTVTVSSRRRAAEFVRRNRRDFAGVAFVLAAVVAYLAPAFKDGSVFGPFDLASHLSGLTVGAYPTIHNGLDGDLVTQMIPWFNLDWHALHSGQFPLWNNYSVLGMPGFLNFESAVLSLPDLVGYLFPLPLAFLAVVGCKLALAGSGTYFFGRVVRIRPAGAAFAGVSFMLSGPMSAWIGWPMTDVFSYAGFLAGFTVLAYRYPGRWRYVVGLAVSAAFFVYGGFPEANLLLAGGLVVLFAAGAVAMLFRHERLSPRGLWRVACGLAAGVGLSAPLWLPGLQVISLAARLGESQGGELSAQSTVLMLVPGYWGLPINGSPSFGPINYYESVSYVGIFALVLALTAIWRFRSRPVVVGLVVALAFTLELTYGIEGFRPLLSLAKDVGLGSVALPRARAVSAFFIAVLGGMGLDGVLLALAPRRRARGDPGRAWSPDRLPHSRGALTGRAAGETLSGIPTLAPPTERPGSPGASDGMWARRYGDSFLVSAVIVAGIVAFVAFGGLFEVLSPAAHRARIGALAWPCVVMGATLLVALLVFAVTRSGFARPRSVLRAAVVVALLGGQTAYLLGFGAGLNTYSNTFFTPTSASAQLKSLVGDSLVGLDATNTQLRQFGGVGFYPNLNIGYGVRQFAGHDPVLPQEYYRTWPGGPQSAGPNVFDPIIDSAALARRYGIGFILAAGGVHRPAGTRLVAGLRGMALYLVPGASQFYFPAPPAGARVLSVSHPANQSWTVDLDTPAPAQVVLAVTALPGWHVTSNGRALPVRTYGGFMESVTVPAGKQTLEVWYFPHRLLEGVYLALVAALALVLWPLFAAVRKRFRLRRAGAPGTGEATPAGGRLGAPVRGP